MPNPSSYQLPLPFSGSEKPSLEHVDQPEPGPDELTPAPRSRVVLNPRPVRVRVKLSEAIR